MLFPIICKIVLVEFVKFSKIVFIIAEATIHSGFEEFLQPPYFFETRNYKLLIPKLRINNQIFTPCSSFLAVFKLIH